MKKIGKTILGLLAVGVIAFNFTITKGVESQTSKYSLANIKTMQASAWEIVCECTMPATCTFIYNGVVCTSYQPMRSYE